MSSTTIGVMPGELTSQIITLNLSYHRKMRVWLGELPPLKYPVVDSLERTLKARRSQIYNRKSAAVEMLIPKGGRAIYGLLGAEFQPELSQELLVKVAVSGTATQQLDWLLASRLDRAYMGLPSEYCHGVLSGALSAAEILGSGLLHINCAAYGEVSSSPIIFNQLASTIVKLLASNIQSVLDSEITAIVEANF